MTMSAIEPSIAQQRLRQARIAVVMLFFALRAGDVGLWLFCTNPANPLQGLAGLVIGSILATTVLLVSLWRRSPWARYILMLVIWLAIAIFSAPGLMLIGGDMGVSRRSLVPLVAGVLCYAAVNVALMFSRRLHRLGTPRGCGE